MNRYLQTQENLKNAEKILSDKRDEFEPLHKSIKAVNSQIKLLENQLENAPEKLAKGELTTEDFLKLKSELAILKESLASFNEARVIQEQSLVPFNNEVNRFSASLRTQKHGMIQDLAKRLMDDLDPSHKDAIKDLIKAFANTNEKAFAFYKQDQNHFYDALGRFIANGIGLPDRHECSRFSAEMAEKLLIESEV
jgi:predicted  nucleic acid-binding Zn-ribbon protein